MEQRVRRRPWRSSGQPGPRPRLLIEDARPALRVSDFTAFRDAGFDVACCSGPGGTRLAASRRDLHGDLAAEPETGG